MGQNWNFIRGEYIQKGLGGSLLVDGDYFFAGTSKGILRSSDYGATWESMNTGLTNLWIVSLGKSSDGIFAGTLSSGIFKSVNHGATWENIGDSVKSENITSITSIGNVIFAGTYHKGLFKSNDGGAHWQGVKNGLPNSPIMSLVSYKNILFALTSEEIFMTKDNGLHWISVSEKTNFMPCSFVVAGATALVGTLNRGVWKRPLSELVGAK
jgi:photosystem II stability/assembly factor-like uncharacterized protein